jgi:hypothetical protein
MTDGTNGIESRYCGALKKTPPSIVLQALFTCGEAALRIVISVFERCLSARSWHCQ